MSDFRQLAQGLDVAPLMAEIERQPELWNRNPARLSAKGPHWQTSDIWLRYKDEAENLEAGDYSNFSDPHDPIWYPAYAALPAARGLIFDLMARVEGERLGGILIYKIEPGKEILPHIDTGWHVDYYDKYNISLRSQEGCAFHYSDGAMRSVTGDLYWFKNNVPHWCTNVSASDQVIMTVCIRTHEAHLRARAG